MVLHSTLSGADLHDPKGKDPTPLDLADNTSNAYLIRNTSSGPSVFAIDTTDSAERLHTSTNVLLLNNDATTASESCSIQLGNGSGVSEYLSTLQVSGAASWQLNSFNVTSAANIATFLHIGESGMTTPNNTNPRLIFNGVNDAAGALTMYLTTEFETTHNREYLTLAGADAFNFTMQSESMIIGGGNHGSWGTLTDCTFLGYDSSSGVASLSFATALGHATSIAANACVAVGDSAAAGATSNDGSIAIGYTASCTSQRGIAIGMSSAATGSGNHTIAIGGSAQASAAASIALGFSAVNALNNACLIGGDDASYYVDLLVFGRGQKTTAAAGTETAVFRTTDGFGGNTNAFNLYIRPGSGYGSGKSGELVLQTTTNTAAADTIHPAKSMVILKPSATEAGKPDEIRLRTHSDGGTHEHFRINTDYVQTTNATATTIWTGANFAATDETIIIMAKAVFQTASDDQSGSMEIRAVWHGASGTPTQVGVDNVIFHEESFTGGSPSIASSFVVTGFGTAQAPAIKVTGIASTTIDWVVTVHTIRRGADL